MPENDAPARSLLQVNARSLLRIVADIHRELGVKPPLEADQAEGLAVDLQTARARLDALLEVLAPLWQVRLARELTPDQRAMLDIDTWAQHEGVSSLDAIICPHCSARRFSMNGQTDHRVACASCGKLFFLFRVPTPHGEAWSSWKTDPRSSPAKGVTT